MLQCLDIDKLQLRLARKVARALNIAQKVNGKDQPLSWRAIANQSQVAADPRTLPPEARESSSARVISQLDVLQPGGTVAASPASVHQHQVSGGFMANQDIQQLDLALIEMSGGTQSRAGFDEETLAEYISAWERGVQFPPIEVYFDGERYWLSDGFHRLASRKRAQIPGSTIAAIVHQGTRRDAVLASVGANATHGLRRTNQGKRRAVMTLLKDPSWTTWSNTAIAKACLVDEGLVRLIKSELSSDYPKIDDEQLAKKCGVDVGTVLEAKSQVTALSEKRTARRNGKTYTVDTSKIGSKLYGKTNPRENLLTKRDSLQQHDISVEPTDHSKKAVPFCQGKLEPTPSPELAGSEPKSGWDISPQQLTTTVKGYKIAIHFEELGDEYFFGFRGPEGSIESSGFHNESISDRARVKREYLNPGVWADFRAEELYADYQKSLAESTRMDEHITATVDLNDADAATSKECIVLSASATPTLEPWAVVAEFSITVSDGSVVQVKFFPEGLVHRFDFRGAVSETGYYCEFIPAQIAQRYRSPKECAQALADELHAQWRNVQAKTQLYKHGIAAGDTVRILLGKGKHSDKITEATSVSAKEIVTPLGTFKASAVVKYVDHTPEMKVLGIVPRAMVETSDGTKAEVVCTFADGRVLVNGRYYHFSQVTVKEPVAVPSAYLKPESAEAEDSGAIARSVESMLPEVLASESEPDYKKSAPADLAEVSSTADMDALIDFQGTTVVARMYVQASPELQASIKTYYPGIGAIVTSELGGSEFNKIADRAGFLPNHEPDAVRVEMLLQENARLDQALRLCEEHVERLERENSKVHKQLNELQKENNDLQERIRKLDQTDALQRVKITELNQ